MLPLSLDASKILVFYFLWFSAILLNCIWVWLSWHLPWTSWICVLLSFINFGKSLTIISSNIASAPFSFSSQCTPIICMLDYLIVYTCLLLVFCFSHSFFFLCFSLNIFIGLIFEFSSLSSLLLNPFIDFIISVIVFFISGLFILFFLNKF